MARFKSIFSVAVTGALCLGLAGVVHAQQTNDELIAKRRAAMTVAATSNGGIRAVTNPGTPLSPEQLTALKEAAGKLVTALDTAKDPALWPQGSGLPDVAAGTKAKPEIWSDAAGYKATMEAAVAAAAKVKSAVDSGDVAQMKTAAAAMQTNCNGCHSKYRT